MRFYLISYHGALMARTADRTGITHLSVGQIRDREELVSVDLDPDTFRQPFVDFIEQKASLPTEADVKFLGPCEIYPYPASRTVAIARNGSFASAPPGGTVEINRTEVKDWEHFLPCSDEDLDFLQRLLAEQWIVKSTRSLINPETITFGEKFNLHIGHLAIPLNYNLPFDQKHAPFRFTVLSEGWKVNEILLFKPMIYYLAFGEDNVFQQLSLSLVSLGAVGHYKGQVWVYSDRDLASIRAEMPWVPRDRFTVKPLRPNDWVGFVAGKYCILEDDDAHHYQPVIYMDPDIIYNADIQAMLIAMAVSDKLTAPIEVFSGLEHAPSVGATLLQLDHELPRFASGFNCGTIGIPNIPSQLHHLKLIRRVICNILGQRGRSALQWVDQEAANYVSYKIAHFETHEVSKYVRWGFEGPQIPIGPLTGLVHFWGVARAGRPQVMRDYLDRVLRHHSLPAADAGKTG
ncbi:hypothetical protein ACELLULO517_24665 [Acidisoma cellulosilytica]|uniref:Uncharacterized protein n=1 Tax=Acidisoma cellulosilyticum TaxID=2802395 RepID=A0A963Z6K5_9PROT|nr:hypothetical protein [Acidisoma cellulosilyticum]MCB8883464.1 hypothetical protein [Acidisoma cellulosilyticum]